MNPSIAQLKHNEDFHSSLCNSFNDHYFDWKITALFYCAYHLIQAFGDQRKIKIGNRHNEILWNLNPKNKNRPTQFKQDAFNAYDDLFEYSQTARYNGFTDFDTFQLMKKEDYKYAKIAYDYLRAYIISTGVII